ncbi:hypothetical protein LCGC14_1455500 [marine sediment metagenome]|uniref:Uncharacterized protein n=1 Tax=marine sediment metagenome TaxID=412755 RepID=A0A0F9K2T5_9ZZZZ
MGEREEVSLELEAYALQREIIESPARFKVVKGGRRSGKTEGGGIDITRQAMRWAQERAPEDAGLWWFAPVLQTCGRGFSVVNRVAKKVITHRTREKGNMSIWFKGGARLEFKATDKEPDNLRGIKVFAAVIDEAPQHSNYVWEQVILPSLIDCDAPAYLIGSPIANPDNWFYQMYLMGLEENDLGIKSWSFPTWANPYLWKKMVHAPRLAREIFGEGYTHVPKFVRDMKAIMSPGAFDLEIAAKGELTSSDYFQAPSLVEMLKAARGPVDTEKLKNTGHAYSLWEKRVPNARYVIGADTAEGLPNGDWSVAYVLRRVNAEEAVQVAEFREHLLPDTFGDVLHELAVHYNMAHVLIEKNNPGLTTILRVFRKGYVNLVQAWDVAQGKPPSGPRVAGSFGWRTDGHSKPVLLGDLRGFLRRKALILNSKGLIRECLALRQLPSDKSGKEGKTELGGPRGSHLTKTVSPDRIIALALAIQGHLKLPFSAHMESESKEARTNRLFMDERRERYEKLTGKKEPVSTLHLP